MKTLLACMLALSAILAFSSAVSAAPKADGRNVQVVPVDCGDLGSFDVITMENSATAFRPDGSVLVAKRFGGTFDFTITTFDGEEFGPFQDSFEEGVPGRGFEDRLTQCHFSETETETFVLDAEAAEFFGIPEEYIGTEVTLDGTFNGTAWVIDPGN